MKRFLLPVTCLSLLCALSSCEYGVYCHVRNATPEPFNVTVVESIVQDKKAARRSMKPNPALDSFTLVARDVPGIENNKPVKSNFYVYTLPAGRELNITSATAGRLLSRVILTRNTDTLGHIRHLRSDESDQMAYYITVKPNDVSETRLPQRKR